MRAFVNCQCMGTMLNYIISQTDVARLIPMDDLVIHRQ